MSEAPEMVERVARAIAKIYGDEVEVAEYDAAKAAIAAMMEPTDRMIEAGINAKSVLYAEFERQGIDTRTLLVANHPAGTIYEAMVQEALKP